VRREAAEALGELGDPRAVEPLLARLADWDGMVRVSAADALGRFGDRRAVEPLVARLADEDSDVRRRTAVALGELGDPRAVEPLLAHLGDEDAQVRLVVAGALAELGDPRAVEPLITYLASKDYWSAENEYVARPLGQLGFSQPAITPELIDRHARDLRPALATAPAYHAHLLRLVHAAGAYATTSVRNDLARLIWAWRDTRAQGITLAQLASDFTALAAETDHPHGPAAANPLVHLYLARLLLADPAAAAERIAAADRHLASAWTHSRADETVLRLLITWLRAEAALRQDDAARAYELLTGASALLAQVRRPERALGLPLASYTLALSSYAASRQRADSECRYEEYGRPFTATCAEAAVDLSQQAERWLGGQRDRFERWWDEQLDEAMQMEMALLVKGFAVLARQRDTERLLADAGQMLEGAQNLPLGWAARQAELLLLEHLVAHAVEQAAQAPDAAQAKAYRAQAQQYAETLALKRYPSGAAAPTVTATGATDAQRQIAALREKQRAEQQLQQEIGRKEAEQRQAAGERDQEKLKRLSEELKALQAKKKNARQALTAFLTALKRSHPALGSLLGTSPQDLAVLQSSLAPNQALLQYVLLDERGYRFLFHGGEIEVEELEDGGRAALTPAIIRYRQLLQGARGADLRGFVAAAQAQPDPPALAALQARLSAQLLGGLTAGDRLQGIDHLILVPNGPLHWLPWATLRWDGQTLLPERFALSQLGAASLLAAVKSDLQEAPLGERLFALGDPLPPEPRWTRLPQAAAELDAVASYFPPTHLYKDQEAVRATMQQADLRGAVVHLAVHGEAGGPGSTHLVLSDGYISDNDILGLQVAGSPMVVLSACESGVGEQLSGDEVVSLANAFLSAGARSVVSTLWPVPDAGTRALMTRFYAHLAAGQGKAAALAQAQRELIAADRPPADWAGVVVTGL
jgi:hypothetical protein